jgi:hypothetical protein
MGMIRNAYNILDGKPEGKRPLGRLRHRWKDNIRMDLRETGCGLDSPGSGWGPVDLGSIKHRKFLEKLSDYWLLIKDYSSGRKGGSQSVSHNYICRPLLGLFAILVFPRF